MRLPQDIILHIDHIDTEFKDGKANIVAEWQDELVRCKDRKHRYISGNGTTRYYVCDFMDAQYEDNGFCHHGERKGGEDE